MKNQETNTPIISERPILFQTDMVKAILEGKKTQTRRTKKLDLINECPVCWMYKGTTPTLNPDTHVFGRLNKDDKVIFHHKVKSSYGKPGDLLWVRETWLKLDRDHVITNQFSYKANGDAETEDLRKDYIKSGRKYQWKPSIHMPKSAARIWLMIEDIRVERLQDISEKDARAEGVKRGHWPFEESWGRSGFIDLWEYINGHNSWHQNPWLWVIKYRILSKTGRPTDEAILASRLSLLTSK